MIRWLLPRKSPAKPSRDEGGRYVSDTRRKVLAKAQQMRRELGMQESEALR
jgi:hypothetical protein